MNTDLDNRGPREQRATSMETYFRPNYSQYSNSWERKKQNPCAITKKKRRGGQGKHNVFALEGKNIKWLQKYCVAVTGADNEIRLPKVRILAPRLTV